MNKMTGPELYESSRQHEIDAVEGYSYGSREETALLRIAQLQATHAQTAAIVMLAGVIASAADVRSAHLEEWEELIPHAPLKKCWSMEVRRPECAERHTADCKFAEPPPEPKHKLIPIGTRVLISERWCKDGWTEYRNPVPGKIVGYDMHKTKYQWVRQWDNAPGEYLDAVQWSFADNRVEVHPDELSSNVTDHDGAERTKET